MDKIHCEQVIVDNDNDRIENFIVKDNYKYKEEENMSWNLTII